MYGKSALEKRQQAESKREMRQATSMTKTVSFLFAFILYITFPIAYLSGCFYIF